MGCGGELIDKDDAWPESSSSAMFSFAMIMGVKHGWLDAKTYGPAARKGWIAVVGYVDQNHDVTQVCEGTGKKDDLAYYYDAQAADRGFSWAGSGDVGCGCAAGGWEVSGLVLEMVGRSGSLPDGRP